MAFGNWSDIKHVFARCAEFDVSGTKMLKLISSGESSLVNINEENFVFGTSLCTLGLFYISQSATLPGDLVCSVFWAQKDDYQVFYRKGTSGDPFITFSDPAQAYDIIMDVIRKYKTQENL